MFDRLIKDITDKQSNSRPPIIAISGFGGSGKTRITDRLRDYFGIADAQVVRLDNLFAPQPCGDGLYDDYDLGLIINVLKVARSGDALIYPGRGFEGEDLNFNEPLPEIIFIEGVRLIRPELMQYFDYSVWLDCPIEIATARGKARDKARGVDDAHLARWDDDWAPKDLKYFNLVRPDNLVNLRYSVSTDTP